MHLICGEALYDVFVNESEFSVGSDVRLKAVAGGSPFNVAIGMARLGARVALASDLARDALGNRIAAQLTEEGVSPLFLRRTAEITALAIVATDELGHPRYSFTGFEGATYCPESAVVDSAESELTGIHVGSIATVLPNSARPLLDLVSRFADRALISLDPNIRLSIIPQIEVWSRAIDDIRPFCQIIKVSEEDLAAIYGDADPATLCRSWLNDRTALVVLTRGAKGAALFSRAVDTIEIAAAKVEVVDTVGAGDSFMAALLSKLTQDGCVSSEAIASLDADQLRALGSFAALAAGITCSRRGPMLPDYRELNAIDLTVKNAQD